MCVCVSKLNVSSSNYLFILINQEVIGTKFENHQTSEQLQRVLALVGLLGLLEVYRDVVTSGGSVISRSSSGLSGSL